MYRRATLLLMLLVSMACHHRRSTPTYHGPRVTKAKTIETRSRVRWAFADQDLARGELAFSGHGVLQFGDHGRRWWERNDGRVEHASDVVTEDLVDAFDTGGGLALLGARGGVFVADDLVGPVKLERRAPISEQARVGGGGKAILAVEPDGTLLRSFDVGATWKHGKLPLIGPERVVDLATNRDGHALVVLRPQRVLLSVDDGETWTTLPTPGIGAHDARRGKDGALYLFGAGGRQAKLAVHPAPLLSIAAWPYLTSNAVANRPRWFVAGNRVVAVREAKDYVPEVAVAPFGSAPSRFVSFGNAAAAQRLQSFGSDGTVVIAWSEENAKVWHLKRTVDDGATWESLGDAPFAGEPRFHAAPGVILASASCETTDTQDASCRRAAVKLANEPFREVEALRDVDIEAMTGDGKRFFVLGARGGTIDLYVGDVTDAKLTRVDLGLPAMSLRAATIDSAGVLRILKYDELIRFDTKLARLPTLRLPFVVTDVALAGDRGFAHYEGVAWETNDGGEHWAKVTFAHRGRPQCSTDGCVLGDEAIRAGWELPDPARALVPSTVRPYVEAPKPSPSPPVTTTFVWCKATGASTTFCERPRPRRRTRLSRRVSTRSSGLATGTSRMRSRRWKRGSSRPASRTPSKIGPGW